VAVTLPDLHWQQANLSGINNEIGRGKNDAEIYFYAIESKELLNGMLIFFVSGDMVAVGWWRFGSYGGGNDCQGKREDEGK